MIGRCTHTYTHVCVNMCIYTVNPRKLEHGFRKISVGFPILYFKGMWLTMFQLSGFHCIYIHIYIYIYESIYMGVYIYT